LCGDLGEVSVSPGAEEKFSRRTADNAIDTHNAECPNTAALHEEV
jgi:hypothetical protein